MANEGIKTLFSSAPRMVIRIGNEPVAFAVGLSCSVDVQQQPVQVIGAYNTIAYEPVAYGGVAGELQIMPLVPRESRTTRLQNAQALANQSVTVDKTQDRFADTVYGTGTSQTTSEPGSGTPMAREGLWLHLDPSRVLLSSSFDIDIYMVYADETGNKTQFLWATLSKCRITSRSVRSSVQSVMDESYSYQGLLYVNQARPNGLRELPDLGTREGD